MQTLTDGHYAFEFVSDRWGLIVKIYQRLSNGSLVPTPASWYAADIAAQDDGTRLTIDFGQAWSLDVATADELRAACRKGG